MTKLQMDKVIKHMGKNQNAKKKLNAGQLREAVRLFLAACAELKTAPVQPVKQPALPVAPVESGVMTQGKVNEMRDARACKKVKSEISK